MRIVISIAVTALVVWLLIYGARHTDEPWWKVWLLARGIVPTSREIRQAEDREPPPFG